MEKKKEIIHQQEIPAKVTQGVNQVTIEFSEEIPKSAVREQVESCKANTCTCCSPEFKEKVDGFEMIEKNNSVDVKIKGSISVDEVKENLISCAPKLKDKKQ